MPPGFLLPVLALAVYFVGATEFMLSPLLTPLAEAFDTTPAAASWLVSGYALSYAMAAPVFGYFSDRIDRDGWNAVRRGRSWGASRETPVRTSRVKPQSG